MRNFLLLALLLIICGCSTHPKALNPLVDKQSCDDEHQIYLISHGWHAGLAIKAEDLNEMLPELSVRFPSSKYYEIGWGDTGFYQSNEITTGLTLRAMFWSKGSVLHVVGMQTKPKETFIHSKVVKLSSDTKNYENLLSFISSSFQRDESHKIIPEKTGIYGNSQFYTGIGKYHIFNTCNKWTAKALYSAGYEISPTFKLTASSVVNGAENFCHKYNPNA